MPLRPAEREEAGRERRGVDPEAIKGSIVPGIGVISDQNDASRIRGEDDRRPAFPIATAGSPRLGDRPTGGVDDGEHRRDRRAEPRGLQVERDALAGLPPDSVVVEVERTERAGDRVADLDRLGLAGLIIRLDLDSLLKQVDADDGQVGDSRWAVDPNLAIAR